MSVQQNVQKYTCPDCGSSIKNTKPSIASHNKTQKHINSLVANTAPKKIREVSNNPRKIAERKRLAEYRAKKRAENSSEYMEKQRIQRRKHREKNKVEPESKTKSNPNPPEENIEFIVNHVTDSDLDSDDETLCKEIVESVNHIVDTENKTELQAKKILIDRVVREKVGVESRKTGNFDRENGLDQFAEEIWAKDRT